jgi:hypothetical protein
VCSGGGIPVGACDCDGTTDCAPVLLGVSDQFLADDQGGDAVLVFLPSEVLASDSSGDSNLDIYTVEYCDTDVFNYTNGECVTDVVYCSNGDDYNLPDIDGCDDGYTLTTELNVSGWIATGTTPAYGSGNYNICV